MNYQNIFEKLVSLLGRSEHDPEVIAVLTELGVKLPLKRPKSYLTYNLLENENWGFHIGFEYASDIPFIENKTIFKEKEMLLQTIQDISKNKIPENTILPYGITWQSTLDELISILGKYAEYDKKWNSYTWVKNNLVILLEFNNDNLNIDRITYRLIGNYDLELINSQKNGV